MVPQADNALDRRMRETTIGLITSIDGANRTKVLVLDKAALGTNRYRYTR
jgi:hypothetical protein